MAMLDLNVDFTPGDSANAEKEQTMEVEDSGTSNSSVVNSYEAASLIADENSMNNSSSTFIFDILKKETQEDAKKENLEIITRSFLPVSGHSGDRDSDLKFGFSVSSGHQWLNLSFAESAGGDAEPKILQQRQPQVRKNRRGPRSRSSQYRGVTFYRRTGRWESHIWDCGKQIYLGGFDTAHAAARAYDRAAIKFRGVDADINFSLSDYEEDLERMRNLSKEEFVHILRRRNTGTPRGSSKYKNVAVQNFGQFEPRMGQFLGKKVYEKPLMKCDVRDDSTSFEPLNYQRGIVVDSNRGGCQNLDLKLGISPPSKELTGNNDAAAQFSFRYAVCEIPKKGEPTANSSGHPFMKGQAIYGLTMAPKYDQFCPAFYPAYLQNFEERGREKRLEAVALPRFSNLAWQLHSDGSIAAAPVFSTAASSRFASSSTNNPSSSGPIPISTHNKSFYNYCSTTASTGNSSCS